jgi:hypothetical protein
VFLPRPIYRCAPRYFHSLTTHRAIDQTSGTAVSSAIPVMKEQLGFDTVQAVWLISAFSLTFASFLLLSGRMSDLFNPSTVRFHRASRASSLCFQNGSSRAAWWESDCSLSAQASAILRSRCSCSAPSPGVVRRSSVCDSCVWTKLAISRGSDHPFGTQPACHHLPGAG